MLTRRRVQLAAVVASAVVLAGCHATATVAIRLRADGRGTVSIGVVLDREARAALAGAALHEAASKPAAMPDVPLDDLRAHGWTVSSWRPVFGGGASVSLSKDFTGVKGLAAVLAELDGRDGALRDARIVRSRALLRDRDAVSLLVDLSHLRAGVADDAALATRLRAAGVDVAALDSALQARIGSSFDLSVRVELPDGTTSAVRVKPGQQRAVSAASTTPHSGRRLALVAAAAASIVGLALFLIAALAARRARRVRRRARTPAE